MQNFIKKIGEILRVCPVCGDGLPPVPWLCLRCEEKILGKLKLKVRWIDKRIAHHYLFDWYPGDHEMAKIVRSLKGGYFDQVYKNLAPCFFLIDERELLNHVLYYPSRGVNDHASALADALTERWGGSAHPILKQGRGKQALRSRSKRETVEFEVASETPRRVILVDDVVTTGATAKACYRALSEPENMTVWSLFYRKSL